MCNASTSYPITNRRANAFKMWYNLSVARDHAHSKFMPKRIATEGRCYTPHGAGTASKSPTAFEFASKIMRSKIIPFLLSDERERVLFGLALARRGLQICVQRFCLSSISIRSTAGRMSRECFRRTTTSSLKPAHRCARVQHAESAWQCVCPDQIAPKFVYTSPHRETCQRHGMQAGNLGGTLSSTAHWTKQHVHTVCAFKNTK